MKARSLFCLLLAAVLALISFGACAEGGDFMPDPATVMASMNAEATTPAEATPPAEAAPVAESETVPQAQEVSPENSQIDENQWLNATMGQDEIVDEVYTIDDFAITNSNEMTDQWVNILLLGTDTKYTEYTKGQYGRSDSMIVMSVNLRYKKVKLTSFMRDLWVEIHGMKKGDKLNAACQYGGPTLTMRTINELFGMNLQYYALVNLSSMAEIIDILGGLDLDVTEAEMKALNKGLFNLSPLSGMEKLEEYGKGVHLNGNQATAFARIRKIDSDYKRTERQRYVLTTIARRLQQEDAMTIIGVVMKLLDCVETNMNFTQLMSIANLGMQMDMDTIEQFRIPADGTYQSGTFDGVWCIKADLKANKRQLHEFIYG